MVPHSLLCGLFKKVKQQSFKQTNFIHGFKEMYELIKALVDICLLIATE